MQETATAGEKISSDILTLGENCKRLCGGDDKRVSGPCRETWAQLPLQLEPKKEGSGRREKD